MNDGGFFERLRNPKAGVTDGTLEKFGLFFAEAGNWPGSEIPQEARDFLHVLGLSPQTSSPSPGSAEKVSPDVPESDPVGGGPVSRCAAEGVAHAITATPEAAQGLEAGA